MDIARHRLHHQRIVGSSLETPAEVVRWLGAVQAQDYLGVLWAVGLRMRGATEAIVERALADRSILRTWPMRGTLHFVAAEDARWMLSLLTPRIVAAQARRLKRDHDIDDRVVGQSREVLTRALEGGKQLSREATYEALEAAGIPAKGQRGLQILWRLSQEGLLCFGPREGKQQTFVLLDEWVPDRKTLDREAALAEVARRYFLSRGPATVQDFAWWTGLAIAEATAGLEMVKRELVGEVIGGQMFWRSPLEVAEDDAALRVLLLPAFDEYTVAYTDRSAVLDPKFAKREDSKHGIGYPPLVIDGQVVGTWKRTLKKDHVAIELNPFRRLSKDEKKAIASVADRYGAFVGLSAVLA